MKKYRKKVNIEAVQWTGKNLDDVIKFTGRHDSVKDYSWNDFNNLVIKEGLKIFALEGKLDAPIGCFIAKGINGECWVIDEKIFHQTYEEIKG